MQSLYRRSLPHEVSNAYHVPSGKGSAVADECCLSQALTVLQAPLKIGNQQVTASITILEDDSMPFLFGLDMLKRYQCCIDLHKNVLRFGSINNAELPFLAEHELPARLRREDSDEQAGGSGGVGGGVGAGSAPGPATLPNAAPGLSAPLQSFSFFNLLCSVAVIHGCQSMAWSVLKHYACTTSPTQISHEQLHCPLACVSET